MSLGQPSVSPTHHHLAEAELRPLPGTQGAGSAVVQLWPASVRSVCLPRQNSVL